MNINYIDGSSGCFQSTIGTLTTEEGRDAR